VERERGGETVVVRFRVGMNQPLVARYLLVWTELDFWSQGDSLALDYCTWYCLQIICKLFACLSFYESPVAPPFDSCICIHLVVSNGLDSRSELVFWPSLEQYYIPSDNNVPWLIPVASRKSYYRG
jgi:hypothetical protein